MLSGSDISRLNKLIEEGAAFALYQLPGEECLHWDSDCDGNIFEIVGWLGKYAGRIGIAEPEAGGQPAGMPVERHSTTHEEYITGVTSVIDNCCARKGKTVYSRVICGDGERIDWGKVAAELFNLHGSSFRFIYNTAETGIWLGATPELLLDFDLKTGDFLTMSLAGTRYAGVADEWDEKNIRENLFVSKDIASKLGECGIEVEVDELETVRYGNIEHLCARISGRSPKEMYASVMDAISPTPALCGWPKADAIDDISRYELHSRGCYGGYMVVRDSLRLRAFVNLRCVHFDLNGYCIFGGGGITALSDPEQEFEETSAKTELLRNIIIRNRK